MLQTKPVTKKLPDFELVKELFRTQFPAQEQMPIWLMLWKAKKDFIDFLAFYDDHAFIGFAYVITKDDLTFILYLAVDSGAQSKRYGSRILNHIKALRPQNRIILNIEAMDERAENNAQREKRRSFYIRNGYEASGIVVLDGSMQYETLISGGECTVSEYHQLFRKFAGSLLYSFFKPKVRMNNEYDTV